MVVIFECGQLGNQIFQYTAMKALMPMQRLIFFGFDDLKLLVSKVDAIILDKKRFPRVLRVLFRIFFLALADARIIGDIRESWIDDSYQTSTRRGLVPGLFLVRPSFFQNNFIVSRLRGDIEIKQLHLKGAMSWLHANKLIINNRPLVFLHIRRGDYVSWPNRKYPAVLSREWYVSAMEKIREKVKDPLFLILTDDCPYAVDVFGCRHDVLISDNNLFTDFALMSLCAHGILSASSFAWWGAWFSRRNKSSGIFIAPKYWAGSRAKKWYPKDFVTDWLTYIE